MSSPLVSDERFSSEELEKEIVQVTQSQIGQVLLNSLDSIMMLLNEHRQILAVNQYCLDVLWGSDPKIITGFRPGEVFHCINLTNEFKECGNAPECTKCGAVHTIAKSQQEKKAVQGECSLTFWKNGRMESGEFRIRVSPVTIDSKTFYVMTMIDISSEKRRAVLERIFFHDVLNTIAALEGWTQILKFPSENESKLAAEKILAITSRLKHEVLNQRMLFSAEKNELFVEKILISPKHILNELALIADQMSDRDDKFLNIEKGYEHTEVYTDPNILIRILVNMIKNAFEAIDRGQEVRVWFEAKPKVKFNVWNPGIIPEDIAMQIFQRSFSTKTGSGRGLGTYSMRLLGEMYLNGRVGFETSMSDGTVFWIELPDIDG